MKKWISWLLVAVLLLSLTACNSPSDTPNDDKADGSTTTTTSQRTDTPMSDAEAVALCTDKIDLLYQLRAWYMTAQPHGDAYDHTIPEGTVVSTLAGTTYTIQNEYFPFSEPFNDIEVDTANELKAIISSVYTEDVAVEHFYQETSLIEYNGVLYRTAADGVLIGIWDDDSIRIKEIKTEAITFLIDAWVGTATYEYTLKWLNDSWKFDQYILGYYSAYTP